MRVIVVFLLLYNVLTSESWHKGSHTLSVNLVMDDEEG